MHFILANYMDDRFFSHLEFSDQGQTSNMYDIAKERSAHNRSRLVFCVPPSLPGWYLPITTDTYTYNIGQLAHAPLNTQIVYTTMVENGIFGSSPIGITTCVKPLTSTSIIGVLSRVLHFQSSFYFFFYFNKKKKELI